MPEVWQQNGFMKKVSLFNDFIDLEIITKDGLVPLCELKRLSPEDYIFYPLHNKKYLLYPDPNIRRVIDKVATDDRFLNITAIKVSNERHGQKRALVFGVSYQQALNVLLKENYIKARFVVPDILGETGTYLIADLLASLYTDIETTGEKIYVLQLWQTIPSEPEVFYIHAKIRQKDKFFIHLDGAQIYFSSEEKTRLFEEGRKLKGRDYSKLFRLDGEIPENKAIEIIRAYMPNDHLTDEFLLKETKRGKFGA